MVFAKQLGLAVDGVINFAPALFMAPVNVGPCLTRSRSKLCPVGSDIVSHARVDDEISSGILVGRLWAQRVFWRCFLEIGVGAGGLTSSTIFFFLIGLARPYRFWRVAIKLPSRNQRTRSNAKTAATLEYEGIKEAFALLGIARMAVGREAGASAHRQRIKAKLKPKAVKAPASKRKAPVVRSRDTKKSAWR